jgi:shikimate dehydrogenase
MIKGAVLGSPISHSLSPQLHELAYKYLNVEGEYSRFDVKAGELQTFLIAHPELNALSLTMPLKEEALSVAGTVSPISMQIKSGNTLSNRNGQWDLTSTDVDGFIQALKGNHIEIGAGVVVIGSGATARAVVAACDSLTSIQGSQIHVIHRNADRESDMRESAPHSQLIFHPWEFSHLINDLSLVVNTTPVGIADLFCDGVSNPQGVFFEALYNPWPTRLLEKFSRAGAQTVGGIDLLVHQGISQVEIFSGVKSDRNDLATLLREKAIEILEQSTER